MKVGFGSCCSGGIEHVVLIMKVLGHLRVTHKCHRSPVLVRTVIKLVFKPRLLNTFGLTRFKITRGLKKKKTKNLQTILENEFSFRVFLIERLFLDECMLCADLCFNIFISHFI